MLIYYNIYCTCLQSSYLPICTYTHKHLRYLLTFPDFVFLYTAHVCYCNRFLIDNLNYVITGCSKDYYVIILGTYLC